MKTKLLAAAVFPLFFIFFLSNCRLFHLGIDDPGNLPEYSWKPRGIGGGGALYGPSISPFDDELMYMSTDMSAVYQTVSGGESWETVHYKNLRGGSFFALRFTSDPDIYYALNVDDMTGGNRYLKKSTDQGQSWELLDFAGQPWYMECDQGSTERLVAVTWDDFMLSVDGGESFSSVTAPGVDLSGCVLAGTFWDGNRIFIGFDDGILYSDDGGQSFSHPTVNGIAGDEAIISLAAAKQNGVTRLFALTHDADQVYARTSINSDVIWNFRSVYRLDFNGSWTSASWQETSHSFLSTERFAFIDTAENDINTVYVAGQNFDREGPLVMKSVDGGESFSVNLRVIDNENVYTGWSGYHGDVDWWWGGCALGFTVSQSNPDIAIITDMGFVHLTNDGGATWRQAYVDPDDQNPPGADTPKSGIYASSGVDQTATWWLTWMSEDILFASMTDINSIRSANAGLRWQKDADSNTGQNTTYKVIKHPSQDLFYAVTSSRHDMYQSTYLEDSRIDDGDGEVKISDNYGASWETVHDFGHPVIDLAFDTSNPDIMYASVADSVLGGIYKTENLSDGAASDWTLCAEPPRTEGHPYNIEVLDDGTLVVTYSGRRDAGGFTLSSGVFVSTNGGDSFSDVSIDEMQRWTKDIVIDPDDPNQDTWYVCVFSHWGAWPNEVGGLYRTGDRGGHWQLISDLYRVESCTVDPLDPDHMYVTTETEGLWETFNLSGSNPVFSEVEDYPFSHPMRVFFNPDDANEIWVTSFGGGIRARRR